MAFPPDVIAIKERLTPLQMETMELLTKPVNPAYLKEYEAMWKSVKKASQSALYKFDEDQWITVFLDSVIQNLEELPTYYYKTAKQKKTDIEKIRKLTKALQAIYKNVVFDQQKLAELCAIPPEETLEIFEKNSIAYIQKVTQRGKRGKNDQAIEYISDAMQRIICSYMGARLSRF